MSDRIVVLGAGPAGITTAWQMSVRGRQVEVVEKENCVGGMGTTFSHGPYQLDYGPHTFHIRETEQSRKIRETILPLLDRAPRILERGTRLTLKGRYYLYPFQLTELLFGLNPLLSLKITWDYLKATLSYSFHRPGPHASFEEWGVKNLGKTLYNICFGIYSQKVWGLPTSQISSKQAQRVAKLNLKNIILRLFHIKADPVSYFQKYFYPYGGIGKLYQRMAEEVVKEKGNVHLQAPLKRISREGWRIRNVVFEKEGREEMVDCEGVISTLPLPVLVHLFDPPLPEAILQAASRLRYRSLVLCYVVIKRAKVTEYHWCYLLDDYFRCNRVCDQKNVSPDLIPEDKTVLCFEISCFYGDKIWSASDEELLDIVMKDVARIHLFKREEIEEIFTKRLKMAYPIYEIYFEKHLDVVLEGLHHLENFVTIGRHGLFLNNSMDDNVELAMKVADFLEKEGWNHTKWYSAIRNYMADRFQGK